MMMKRRIMRKSRALRTASAAAAVICAAMMLGSCSLSELFSDLPGENATELYDKSNTATMTVPPPETPSEADTEADSSESADQQAVSASAESQSDTSSEERKIILLNAPGNSAAAEYFLESEPDQVKDGYRRIYEGIFNFQSIIELEHGAFDSESAVDLINLVLETGTGLDVPDTGYRMYVDNDKNVTKIEFKYNRSFEEGGQMYEQLMARADEIVNEAKPLLSEYDKIKYFHDEIINNCDYDTAAPNGHTAYGALCDRAGILALPAQGNATDIAGRTEAHMWNKVRCDGEWFNIDVTWDDPTGGVQALRYDYFLIDDVSCSRSHDFNTNRYVTLPSATNGFGDYYSRNGLVIGYDDDIYNQVYSLTSAALSGEWTVGTVDMRCLDQNLYTQVEQQFFANNTDGDKGYSDLVKMFMQSGESIQYEFAQNPQTYTFHVTITKT